MKGFSLDAAASNPTGTVYVDTKSQLMPMIPSINGNFMGSMNYITRHLKSELDENSIDLGPGGIRVKISLKPI